MMHPCRINLLASMFCFLALPWACQGESDLREILKNPSVVEEGKAVATTEVRPPEPGVGSFTVSGNPASLSQKLSTLTAFPTFSITIVSIGGNLSGFLAQLRQILQAWLAALPSPSGKPAVASVPTTRPGPSVSPGSNSVSSARPSPAASSASSSSAADASMPKPGAKGGKALLAWLQKVGLTGEKLRTAWAIAMRESGGNPKVHNNNRRTGDDSYGLFQINMLGSMGPARRKQLGISSNKELLDPMVNCRAMMKLSRNGKDFGPWGIGPNAYRHSSSLNAAFKKYYNQFPPK